MNPNRVDPKLGHVHNAIRYAFHQLVIIRQDYRRMEEGGGTNLIPSGKGRGMEFGASKVGKGRRGSSKKRSGKMSRTSDSSKKCLVQHNRREANFNE